MQRTLPKTGLTISAVAILFLFELALFGALLHDPPKRHSEAFIAAQTAARENPTDPNFMKLGEMVQEEENRPVWKDSVSIEYYAVIVVMMIVDGWLLLRMLRPRNVDLR